MAKGFGHLEREREREEIYYSTTICGLKETTICVFSLCATDSSFFEAK